MNNEIDLFGFGCVMWGIGVESALAIIDVGSGRWLTAALQLPLIFWLSFSVYREARRRQR